MRNLKCLVLHFNLYQVIVFRFQYFILYLKERIISQILFFLCWYTKDIVISLFKLALVYWENVHGMTHQVDIGILSEGVHRLSTPIAFGTVKVYFRKEKGATFFRWRLSLIEKVEGFLVHLRVWGHCKSWNLNKNHF